MRILVADDDLITRKFLTAALRGAGHEVEAFPDGVALWDAYERDPSPMVVVDWLMPGLTGIDVCRLVRQSRLHSYTHVLVVTSLTASEHTVEAYRAGADDFLGKPVDADHLLRRVAVAERGMLAQAEGALRTGLDICQSALGPEHEGLLRALDGLAVVSRQQRAYVRCRAFLRRQHGIAVQSFGASDPRARRLAEELEEMTALEERF